MATVLIRPREDEDYHSGGISFSPSTTRSRRYAYDCITNSDKFFSEKTPARGACWESPDCCQARIDDNGPSTSLKPRGSSSAEPSSATNSRRRSPVVNINTPTVLTTVTVLLLTFTTLPQISDSLKLPNYISPCKRSDPKLDECVVRHGQLAIPKFINGDPKYRVPKLDPLEITELVVNQGTKQIGLALTLKNTKIYGLRNAKFVRSKTDVNNSHAEWEFMFDRLEIIGGYFVDGKVMILPIKGEGESNVTITDLKITYKYDWDLVKKANGKEYMNFTKSDLLFENGRTYFKLENLFNGDKTLGDNMNYFLNENWKEVTKELGPAVGEAISEVFRLLLTNIAELVPFEYIYPN